MRILSLAIVGWMSLGVDRSMAFLHHPSSLPGRRITHNRIHSALSSADAAFLSTRIGIELEEKEEEIWNGQSHQPQHSHGYTAPPGYVCSPASLLRMPHLMTPLFLTSTGQHHPSSRNVQVS